ncbi:thaumatin-like protein 1 [Miscanthus floridulus]|uniref:thaumatin-like protein 1 n=1 Tax=Miscanthus floridulus TaxID=154761 RepID=UPI0034584B7A
MGQVACNGGSGAPLATLAESSPRPGGRCRSASCPADINPVCPSEQAVRAAAASAKKDGSGGGGSGDDAVVGCKSACLAFGTDEYCCRGKFASPATCKPSGYSKLFKA